MKTLPDTIFTPDTLPQQRGEIMGMHYDERAKAWKLVIPYWNKAKGYSTNLKATIKGPKRVTQAEAMRKWLELEEKAKRPESSLTLGELCEQYIADNSQLKKNILSIIGHIKSGAGSFRIQNFAEEYKRWIDKESKRTVRNTERLISKSTIQAYMRYTKLILRHSGHGEAFEGLKIGKRIIRRRSIEPWEMLKIEEIIESDYRWFYPAFDFARTNPIRPEDQFTLTIEEHVKRDRIIYAPIKTYGKTGLMAYPIVFEHQRPWFDGLVSGLMFRRPGGSALIDTKTNTRYYDFVWKKILSAAGVSGIQFYDLRHHAVAWMRSQGIEDWRIVKAAGWSSTQMLVEYDPDNQHLIEEYDKKLSVPHSTNQAPEKEKTA